MQRRSYKYLSLLSPLLALIVSGCGEAYPEQAQTYSGAAEAALIAQGSCADTADCSKKELIFVEGGNPWIPGLKKVYVNIYGIKDLSTIDAVARSITQLKSTTSGPPFLLTIYSSSHSEPKVKFKEVGIN